MDITELTVHELQEKLKNKERSFRAAERLSEIF